jgi:hypothetical protein
MTAACQLGSRPSWRSKHSQAGDSPQSLRIIGFNLLAFDFFARVPGFRWGI